MTVGGHDVKPSRGGSKASPDSSWHARARSLFTTVLPVATLVLSVLVFLSQRQLTTQQQAVTQEQNIADRFEKLAGDLGSSSSIVRIAGIYGLRDLAEDEPRTRARVVKMLAADIHTVALPTSTNSNEVAVAIGTLRTVTESMDPTPIDLHVVDRHPLGYDLGGTLLSGYSLSHLKADHGSFLKADLSFSDLSSSRIGCTDLSQVDLHGVDLRGAVIDNVRIDRADLSGIRLDSRTKFGHFYWTDPPMALPVDAVIDQAGTGEDFDLACSHA